MTFVAFAHGVDLPMACVTEEPDFVVKDTGEGGIGIELTEYYQDAERDYGSQLERLRKLRLTLIDLARGAYLAINSQAVRLTIFWWDTDLSDESVKAAAARLAQLIDEKVRLAATGYDRIAISDDDLLACHIDGLFSDLLLHRCRPGHGNVWYSPHVTYPYTTAERIRAIIAEKEEKLPRYRRNCPVVWLVIHGKLGAINMSDEVLGETYATAFARVYLWDVDSRPMPLRLSKA